MIRKYVVSAFNVSLDLVTHKDTFCIHAWTISKERRWYINLYVVNIEIDGD